MSSTYSSNLRVQLMGTGDQSGTWGNTTNTNLGTLLEQAVCSYVVQTFSTDADVTLLIADGADANSNTSSTIYTPGNTSIPVSARNAFIECQSGVSLTATRSLIVPAYKKSYFVYNNTTGGQSITVKVSGQTGVTIPNGQKTVLWCNGTDIIYADTMLGAITYSNSTGAVVIPVASAGATLTVGSALGYSDTGLGIVTAGSTNGYWQEIVGNTSAGAAASADLIVNNNLSTANTYYGDFGMNSSGFTGSGSLSAPNYVYMYSASTDLVIGTSTANNIRFVVNSSATDSGFVNGTTGSWTVGPAISGSTAFSVAGAGGGRGTVYDIGTPSGPAWRVQSLANYYPFFGLYETGQTNGWWLTRTVGPVGTFQLGYGASEGSGTAYFTLSTAGNAIYTATSGNTVSANAASGGIAFASAYASGGGFGFTQTVTSGNTSAIRLGQTGIVNWDILNVASTGQLYISNGSVTAMAIAQNGTSTTFTSPGACTVSLVATGNTPGSNLALIGGSGNTNWSVGSNVSSAGRFEITPSTAIGGSAFNVPVFTMNNTGGIAIGSPTGGVVAGGSINVSGGFYVNGVAVTGGGGGGTVTSVGGTGTVNGISLSGSVSTSGNLTLSGGISGSLVNCTVDGVNAIGYRNLPQSSSTTAATSDVGKSILATGTITIPNATFNAGDAFTIVNNSSGNITIQSNVSTLHLAGTATTGNRTLAQWGSATIYFISSTVATISGAGLT